MYLVMIPGEDVMPKPRGVVEVDLSCETRKELLKATFEDPRFPEHVGIIEHEHAPASSKQISVCADEPVNICQMPWITARLPPVRGEAPKAQWAPHEKVDWPQSANTGFDHLLRQRGTGDACLPKRDARLVPTRRNFQQQYG
jgi:hypothetical protein